MILYATCHNCKKEIRFSSPKSNRVELSKLYGCEMYLVCKKCGQKQPYHINSIKATESKIAQIIALSIFLIGTPLMLLWMWDYIFQFNHLYTIAGLVGVIGIPFMVYSVIEKEEKRKVRDFNRYKIEE